MAEPGKQRASLWWQNPWVLTAFILASATPILFVTLPPLTDYFGHMGRYRVELGLATSPELQRNWDFHWALIANLGVDLLIVPLANIFGLERAIWIVALVLPPFLAWGFVRAAKATHGAVPAVAIATFPLALAYPYQYGFVNYWLGLGIAFHVYAFWRQIERPSRLHMAGFAAVSLALWICHIFAWGVMCVLVGCTELARFWNAGERNPLKMAWHGIARAWPLMLPLLLTAIWRTHGEGATTLGWFRWEHKFLSFIYTLRDQSQWLDIGSLIYIVLLIYSGIRSSNGRIDRGLGAAAAAFFVIAIIFPFQLFGSAYADARVWPVLMMVGLLAIRFEPDSGTISRAVAACSALIFVARITVSTLGFVQYEADNNRHLLALDHVARGSRVAVIARYPCPALWRRWRIEHMGSIALLRRDAFVNSQWDVPGAQLLRPLAARGTDWNADPSQFLGGRVCENDMHAEFRDRIKDIPRDRFDYVWLLDIPTRPLPAYPGLKPLYWDERTVLYALEKGSAL